MTARCQVCGKQTVPDSQIAQDGITKGICEACILQVSDTSNNRKLLESINTPILLMQGNPRQVITANRSALKLFGKELPDIEGHRGGQVFDCVHSFTEAGCGKDINCEHCKIKNAIVDTFTTANSHHNVTTELPIKKNNEIKTYALQVSTQKVGDLTLVRIDRYDTEA
jgi:hypothetical protein